MTPRHDHRRPAAAFAVLFVVALLVLGNGLRARAAVGGWAAADPVLPRLIQTLVRAPGDHPSPAGTSAVGARHRSPLVGSRGRRSPQATPPLGPGSAVHPVRRTPAAVHRSRAAEAGGPGRRGPAGPDRSVPGRAVGNSHRVGPGRQPARHVPSGHAVGAAHTWARGHHDSGR